MARRPIPSLPRAVSIILVMTGVGILTASIFYPAPRPPVADDPSAAPAGPTTADAADTADSDLSDLGDLDLHKPLIDPPAATRPASADALLQLRLTGTIIEPQHSYAILSSADGRTEIKSVGDRFNGVRLDAVTADSVTLDVNGRAVVLHAVKPASFGRLPS